MSVPNKGSIRKASHALEYISTITLKKDRASVFNFYCGIPS